MHLTKSEQQIMEIFWQADHPMAQTEVIHTCEDRKWKERSIFSMLNSLMAKGVLREVGFVRSGKTYARTFEPAISHAEYLALVVAEQLPAKQFPELLASLLQRVEITPAIQKALRAAVRENGPQAREAAAAEAVKWFRLSFYKRKTILPSHLAMALKRRPYPAGNYSHR